MRTPRNLKQALQRGFRVEDQAERGIPEFDGQTRGKIRLQLDTLTDAGPGYYELVVPYVARYRFGTPRPARSNEKF